MKAIICESPGTAVLVSDRSAPTLRSSYLKVAVKAVALNPTDWKSVARLEQPGHLVGADYCGVVQEVGTGYTKDWKVGDRIAGLAHGCNSLQKEDGAFAETIVVKADTQLKVLVDLSDTDAATLGVGFITCGQGLFQALGLNLPTQPTKDGEYVFIYGGSSATGALGIQYATLAGYKVISTASPHNNDYVKSLGAVAVFNHYDPGCADAINDYTGGKLNIAWDTISIKSSAEICAKVLAPNGRYAALLPTKCPREDVHSAVTMGYTATGEACDKGWFKSPGSTEDFEFAKKWATITEKLLADGKLKPHNARVSTNGLEGVLDGLDQLKNDKVSGEKLVYVL